VVNEVFTPSEDAIAEAEAVVRAFDDAVAAGAGVATLANGQFIDAPIAARAKAVLALAALLK